MGIKQKKKKKNWKKKFKMADSKKQSFSKSPTLKIFLRKFHRWIGRNFDVFPGFQKIP
jgi:hypothetical protein